MTDSNSNGDSHYAVNPADRAQQWELLIAHHYQERIQHAGMMAGAKVFDHLEPAEVPGDTFNMFIEEFSRYAAAVMTVAALKKMRQKIVDSTVNEQSKAGFMTPDEEVQFRKVLEGAPDLKVTSEEAKLLGLETKLVTQMRKVAPKAEDLMARIKEEMLYDLGIKTDPKEKEYEDRGRRV